MNASPRLSLSTLICGALIGLPATTASADPLPGQIAKFQQLPMVQTEVEGITYFGHDELSTLYAVNPGADIVSYEGLAMADDFADRFATPVVHVRWWGSYLGNSLNPDAPVDRFLIAFESDVPAEQNPAGFSHPGEVLSSQIVNRGPLSPGSGTFTEKLILDLPEPGEDIYEYNAELHLGKEFAQKPETVYWLKIAALVDDSSQSTRWGWHNRDYTVVNPEAIAVTPPIAPGERDERLELGIGYPTPVWHFQDDSVSAETRVVVDEFNMPDMPLFVQQNPQSYEPQRYFGGLDGPPTVVDATGMIRFGIDQFSKDLAFEIYTVPEPSALGLALLGLVALIGFRRRRRTAS